jgi:hypothetical protein
VVLLEICLESEKLFALEVKLTGLEAEPLLRLITCGAIGFSLLYPYAFIM